MDVPRGYETLLSKLLSKTSAQKQGHKNTSGPTTTPDGRRKMRWRTAPAPWQKRFLHYRSTTLVKLQNPLLGQDANLNCGLVAAENIKTAAALAAATVAPASGYEVEFFTGQLDRVGKLFHIVHFTRLGC